MKFDSHSIFGPIGLELVLRKPEVWKDWKESSLNFVCAKVENCYSAKEFFIDIFLATLKTPFTTFAGLHTLHAQFLRTHSFSCKKTVLGVSSRTGKTMKKLQLIPHTI